MGTQKIKLNLDLMVWGEEVICNLSLVSSNYLWFGHQWWNQALNNLLIQLSTLILSQNKLQHLAGENRIFLLGKNRGIFRIWSFPSTWNIIRENISAVENEHTENQIKIIFDGLGLKGNMQFIIHLVSNYLWFGHQWWNQALNNLLIQLSTFILSYDSKEYSSASWNLSVRIKDTQEDLIRWSSIRDLTGTKPKTLESFQNFPKIYRKLQHLRNFSIFAKPYNFNEVFCDVRE